MSAVKEMSALTEALFRGRIVYLDEGVILQHIEQKDDHCWLNCHGRPVRILAIRDGCIFGLTTDPAGNLSIIEMEFEPEKLAGYCDESAALLRGAVH